MTFIGILEYETEIEEAERLAESPVGSISHNISKLPVINDFVDPDAVYELPWADIHTCSGSKEAHGHKTSLPCHGKHRVIGIPLARQRSCTKTNGKRLHDGTWAFKILASDHPRYPAGGYDICVSDSELRRSRIVNLLEL